MVTDGNAGPSMAASIERSLEAAVTTGDALNHAGLGFARMVAAEIRVDEGWLPADAAIAQLGEDALDSLLRIVAAGMVDDWPAAHRVWAYQSRLYRHCAFGESDAPERRLSAAGDYRVGDESPNPIEPDIVLIALRTPARPEPEIAREVLLDLIAAHRVTALDVNDLAKHGPRNSQRSAAVAFAGRTYFDMANDAEVAVTTLTAEMRGVNPQPDPELSEIRDEMAAVGSAMLSLYPDDDSPERPLVRAFGRHLTAGDSAVPSASVAAIPVLIEAVGAGFIEYSERRGVGPNSFPINGIESHLRRVALETDDEVSGARLAAPFPDRHLASLTRQLLLVEAAAHSDAVTAIETGADFVVSGLMGLADRYQGEHREVYLFAARSVARTSRAAREHLLWAQA